MKKKVIIISLCIVIIVYVLAVVQKKDYIIQNGTMLALTLDDEIIYEFPARGNYTVNIVCKNGNGIWLPEKWNFVVENITGPVSCKLDFKTANEKDRLTNIIATLKWKTSGNGSVTVDHTVIDNSIYKLGSKLELSDYVNAVGYDMNTGEVVENPYNWNDNDKIWELTSTSENLGTYNAMISEINAGKYQLCYTLYGNSEDMAQIGLGNFDSGEIYGSESGTTGCFDVEASSTTMFISLFAIASENSKLTVYTQERVIETEKFDKVENKYTDSNQNEITSGYRYIGGNPNNYIWFNNEMWRIIGSVPTKVDSEGNIKDLVKIIRVNTIGELIYDTGTAIWGSNTLYKLLNENYYSSNPESLNAQNSGYCLVASSISSKCDYSNIGILSTSYYGGMLKNVYWNVGISSNRSGGEAYALELLDQSVQGYIGLMTMSDYSFINGTSGTINNWLHRGFNELISTPNSATKGSYLLSNGNILNLSDIYGYGVRPVAYLDESIYVVSGDGSEANPYQIAMPS